MELFSLIASKGIDKLDKSDSFFFFSYFAQGKVVTSVY